MYLPTVTTPSRRWLPFVLDEDIVVTNKSYAVYDYTNIDISVFSSRMHMAWSLAVCGRLGNALTYSNKISWNTFPVPDFTKEDKNSIKECAEGILLARDHFFEHTVYELYDPDHMQDKFPELWRAHQRNDEVLETIYHKKPFENDTERLKHLFARYVEMTSKLAGKQKGAKK